MSKKLSMHDQAYEDHARWVKNIYEAAKEKDEWYHNDFCLFMLALKYSGLHDEISEALQNNLGIHPEMYHKWLGGSAPSRAGIPVIVKFIMQVLEEFVIEYERSEAAHAKVKVLKKKVKHVHRAI